jgi:hypothetical protein
MTEGSRFHKAGLEAGVGLVRSDESVEGLSYYLSTIEEKPEEVVREESGESGTLNYGKRLVISAY